LACRFLRRNASCPGVALTLAAVTVPLAVFWRRRCRGQKPQSSAFSNTAENANKLSCKGLNPGRASRWSTNLAKILKTQTSHLRVGPRMYVRQVSSGRKAQTSYEW